MAKEINLKRFAIRNQQGAYYWGMTHQSGVGFENDKMPKFYELSEHTILYHNAEQPLALIIEEPLLFVGCRIVPLKVRITAGRAR